MCWLWLRYPMSSGPQYSAMKNIRGFEEIYIVLFNKTPFVRRKTAGYSGPPTRELEYLERSWTSLAWSSSADQNRRETAQPPCHRSPKPCTFRHPAPLASQVLEKTGE